MRSGGPNVGRVIRRSGGPSRSGWAIQLLLAALSVLGLRLDLGHAHVRLDRTVPADGALVTDGLDEVRFVFSGKIELAFSRIEILDPEGNPVPISALRHPGDSTNVIVGEVRELIRPGAYTIIWQTAAADGHPMRGRLGFTLVLEPEAQAAAIDPGGLHEPPSEARTEVQASALQPSRFGGTSPAYAIVRWLSFVATLGIIGLTSFRLLVLSLLRRRSDALEEFIDLASARAAQIGFILTVALAIVAPIWAGAQWRALHGGPGFDPAGLRAMFFETGWGRGWMLHLAATLAALIGFAQARRRSADGWGLLALSAVGLAFAPALSGHAGANPNARTIAVIADGLHVLGGGGWLGSLFAIMVVGVPIALRKPGDERGRSVAILIDAFSPTALFFATVLVGTGVLTASLNLGSVQALWSSAYGRTLLLKLGILLIVLAAGAYNWLRVRPALGHDATMTGLRRGTALELGAGLLVLAVTSVLVATAPPREGAPLSAPALDTPSPTSPVTPSGAGLSVPAPPPGAAELPRP